MTADELADALSRPDVAVRCAAVAAVARSPREELGPQLLRALGDTDFRVREEAVAVLRETILGRTLIADLVEGLLQGDNVGLRNAAREVLRSLGAVAAPALAAAAREAAPAARKFVLEAMACGPTQDATETLVQAVRGDDPLLALSAMDALSQRGGEPASAALRAQLTAADGLVRAAALEALVRMGVVPSWDELAPFMEDRVLSRVALPTLGHTGDARAIAPLICELGQPSPRGVACALLGLARLHATPDGPRDALVQAASALAEPTRLRIRSLAAGDDLELASAACVVLACARDAAVITLGVALVARGGASSPLAAALSIGEDAAVEQLIGVAGRLERGGDGPRAAIELVCELFASRDLPSVHDAPLRTALVNALGFSDEPLRHTALRALARFAHAEEAPRLLAHAASLDVEEAQLAGAALTALGARHAHAVREALAGSAFTGFAGALLAQLAVAVGVGDVLDRLRDALLSDDVSTRMAALGGLARLSSAETSELVLLALADGSPQVQVAAFDALTRISERSCDGSLLASARRALLAWCGDDADAQAALARALCLHDGDEVRVRLRDLAAHGSKGARLYALQGLLRMSDPALDALLADALGDEDTEIVKQAVAGIAQVGGSRAGVRIATVLSHASWDVRRFAASCIERLHATDALAALRGQLARETDEYVRTALRTALLRLGEG